MVDRDKFDKIYNYMTNGNMTDVYEGMRALDGYQRGDLLDYLFVELKRPEAALKVAKVYFQFHSNRHGKYA